MPSGCFGLQSVRAAERIQHFEKPGGETQFGEYSIDVYIHLSATGVSRRESLRTHAKSWSRGTQVSGLAGGSSFAGVYSHLHAELDSPAKN